MLLSFKTMYSLYLFDFTIAQRQEGKSKCDCLGLLSGIEDSKVQNRERSNVSVVIHSSLPFFP